MKNDQLTEAAKLYGQQLGALIAMADIPEEQKEAWMALLPEMSFEQIERLHTALEKRVSVQAGEEFGPLLQQMQKIKQEYEAKVAAIQGEAVSALDDLDNELNNLS